MAPKPPPPLPFLLLTISSVSAADLSSELQTLQSKSPSGVIRFDDDLVSHFLTSAPSPRPYTLFLFFDASKFHSNPHLNLPHLLSEFKILSKSSNATSLFFGHLDFADSRSAFAFFAVTALPHILLVPAGAASIQESSKFMDQQAAVSGGADSMADFLARHANITVAPIVRPPLISTNQIMLFVVAVVVIAPFAVPRIVAGKTPLHDRYFWMGLSLLVYWFSVSGYMSNIIRRVPLLLAGRGDQGRVQFF